MTSSGTNKIGPLKVYESEYRRIEVAELLSVVKERGISQFRLLAAIGWSNGFFWRLKRKKYLDLHKNDLENLQNFLRKS